MIAIPDEEILALRERLTAHGWPADDLTDEEVTRDVILHAMISRLRQCPLWDLDRIKIRHVGAADAGPISDSWAAQIHEIWHRYREQLEDVKDFAARNGTPWPPWVPPPPRFPTPPGISPLLWDQETLEAYYRFCAGPGPAGMDRN